MSKEFEEIVLKKLEKLDNLEVQVENLGKEVRSLKTTAGKLETEVRDTGEVVNYLNQNFTKFDHEMNTKINTLFDAFITNKENNYANDKEIVSLNAKVLNQDIRISNLEKKVLTA